MLEIHKRRLPFFCLPPEKAALAELGAAQNYHFFESKRHKKSMPPDVDAKKHFGQKPKGVRDVILDDLRRHPHSTVRDISKRLGRNVCSTHKVLCNMRRDGFVATEMRNTPSKSGKTQPVTGHWYALGVDTRKKYHADKKSATRKKILAAMKGKPPMDAYEIGAASGFTYDTARRHLSWLWRENVVECTYRTIETKCVSGSRRIRVWALVEDKK